MGLARPVPVPTARLGGFLPDLPPGDTRAWCGGFARLVRTQHRIVSKAASVVRDARSAVA